MNFKDLEYVCAIAKHKSITRAAQALFITQPTLSQYIKNLQERLGVSLFYYEGNKILLTDEGNLLVSRGLGLLDSRDLLLNDLYTINQTGRGVLKIAIPLGRGIHLLPSILPEFHRLYPLAEIRLSEGSSMELVNLVENRACDLVVINYPTFPANIEFETIGYENMLLIMGKSSPYRTLLTYDKKGRPHLRLSDLSSLSGEPSMPEFVLHKPNQHTGQVERKLLKNFGICPKIILETRNLEASYHLAAKGCGMTFLSEYQVNLLDTENKTYNCLLDTELSQMKVVVGYRDKSSLSFLAREFLRLIRDYLSQHSKFYGIL